MIEVSGLQKRYGSIEAISNVNFKLNKGEAVGLLGLNGAGKTTTLSILATTMQPSAGSVIVAGYTLPRDLREVRKTIGFMPDTPPLYSDMRVSEYLNFIGKLRGLARKELSLALASVVERCNLGNVQNSLCGHLSRGYAQRVSLAQALIHDPDVLILDEPTSGLDPEQVLEIRALLRLVATQKTLLLSSHVLSEVQAICSRVLIMHAGRIRQSLSISDLSQEETLEMRFLQVINHGSSRRIPREAA